MLSCPICHSFWGKATLFVCSHGLHQSRYHICIITVLPLPRLQATLIEWACVCMPDVMPGDCSAIGRRKHAMCAKVFNLERLGHEGAIVNQCDGCTSMQSACRAPAADIQGHQHQACALWTVGTCWSFGPSSTGPLPARSQQAFPQMPNVCCPGSRWQGTNRPWHYEILQ